MSRFSTILVPLLCVACWLDSSPVAADDPVDFGRDIRRILSDKCFLCHGPDETTREADLRLDIDGEALRSGVLGEGDLESSTLWERITSTDPDMVMPPPDSEKRITDAERTLIERWIRQGASYSEHWAFRTPRRPSVPQLPPERAELVNNDLDAFVLSRAHENGLKQAPLASKTELVRRLYLDLIGLPPSPNQVDSFLRDQRSDAYALLVDELLQSPHFGEHWARWWLDAARYADSDGYEKDKPRSVWFYRDWVINALNNNVPYDQFVIEQLAGDLLPDAGQSQRVATGFLRNSMINEEGGADPEQFRVEGMFDRMDAIGKAILGITTQCAQCHTHKYDPLSQSEYYQMFAALNDFEEATITVFTPEQAAQRNAVEQRLRTVAADIKSELPDWKQRLEQWEDDAQTALVPWRTLTPTDLPFEGQKFKVLDDGSILSQSYAPTRVTNTFTLTTTAEKITAFRLDALQHPQLPRGGPGRSIYGTGALTEFSVSIAPADKPGQAQPVKWRTAYADVNPERTSLPAVFRDRKPKEDERVTGPIEYAIDGDNQTAWSTDNGPGRRNQNRHAIFVPEQPLEFQGPVVISFTLKQNHGGWNSDDNQNYLLGRYRFSITHADLPITHLPSRVESILQTSQSRRTDRERADLFDYWWSTLPEQAARRTEVEQAWQAFPKTDTQLVAYSLGAPRNTYVLTRGDFLNPAEQVAPGVPEFLDTRTGSNERWQVEQPTHPRLRLARWMVRPEAPTTARVVVNRIWQAYFGRGLVTSPEDFGYQSTAPSHPQLLDWLAVELVEHDWDLKHVHRLIVESATYRQSSRATEDQIAADPANQWLARGPRFRVRAETVRDAALSISGLLDPTVGGPSIYPPAPAFLFQPPASYGPKVWATSTDGEQYRRSLYVHRFRSVLYPTLQVFDAPKGDAACVRRERSNTPMQALVLLNEPQFVECARAMAGRVLREAGPTDADRLTYAFRLAVSREPAADEQSVLQQLLEQQRERLAAKNIDVQQLIGVEGSLYHQLTGVHAEEAWPWIIVCRAILNLDEVITKQ